MCIVGAVNAFSINTFKRCRFSQNIVILVVACFLLLSCHPGCHIHVALFNHIFANRHSSTLDICYKTLYYWDNIFLVQMRENISNGTKMPMLPKYIYRQKRIMYITSCTIIKCWGSPPKKQEPNIKNHTTMQTI